MKVVDKKSIFVRRVRPGAIRVLVTPGQSSDFYRQSSGNSHPRNRCEAAVSRNAR